MNRYLLSLALFAACPLVCAADWSVDDGSTLGFSGRAQGESFQGRFGDFQARIRFDPADLGNARFEVDIALASADTQNAERDELLQGGDFFDSASQPNARFSASRFSAQADGSFVAEGTLALKGQTKPVNLQFRWSADANQAKLEGEATLDRTAFGIGLGDWEDAEMIGHEVKVETSLLLRQP